MSKFRIQSKKVFLTYPQTDIAPEMVRDNLLEFYPDTTAYIIAQEEHKEEGLHIHTYIEFTDKLDIKNQEYFDKLGGKHGNYQAVKEKESTIRYVLGLTEDKGMKLNERMLVKGIDVKKYIPKERTKKEQKTIDEIGLETIEIIKQGGNQEDVIKANPQLLFKSQSVRQAIEIFRPKVSFNLLEEYSTLRPYQQYILEIANQQPDKRKIYWIYDNIGNAGKTELADHLEDQLNFKRFVNGKTADIAHSWNGENVVFDLSRTTEGRINWEVIEQLKNGRVFSGKYESCSKKYNRPHLFVFSNFLPEVRNSYGRDTISRDRWEIYEMEQDYTLKDITQLVLEENYGKDNTEGWNTGEYEEYELEEV